MLTEKLINEDNRLTSVELIEQRMSQLKSRIEYLRIKLKTHNSSKKAIFDLITQNNARLTNLFKKVVDWL